jgi:hypothetical protein
MRHNKSSVSPSVAANAYRRKRSIGISINIRGSVAAQGSSTWPEVRRDVSAVAAEALSNTPGLSRRDCREQRDSQDDFCERFHGAILFLWPSFALAVSTANLMFCRVNGRRYENRNPSKTYYNYFE